MTQGNTESGKQGKSATALNQPAQMALFWRVAMGKLGAGYWALKRFATRNSGEPNKLPASGLTLRARVKSIDEPSGDVHVAPAKAEAQKPAPG